MQAKNQTQIEDNGGCESEAAQPLVLPAAYAPETGAVRAVIAADAEEHSAVTLAARDSFGAIHTQLMETIDADVAARQRQAGRDLEKSTSAFFLANWMSGFSHLSTHVARYAVAALLFIAVGVGGHQYGMQQSAQILPIESIVQDFDDNLKSPAPLDFISQNGVDEKPAAKWLSTQVGHRISLPAPTRTGTRLVGVRRHELDGRAVAQAHYLKNGVRVALYQIRDPRAGLNGMETTSYRGRTFLASQHGAYHVVVWRKGEDIVTMVSPLSREPSLRLAAALREASPDV
jgi:anti-sigma factor RsiW